jgi:hypothetical protein
MSICLMQTCADTSSIVLVHVLQGSPPKDTPDSFRANLSQCLQLTGIARGQTTLVHKVHVNCISHVTLRHLITYLGRVHNRSL